ncbi:NCS2 family permease [Mycobacterium sp. D16Q16]|uniref:NCS2 family permease n=1 Tax=Mycobacterium sp. D16Q16 TaxID=1855659 RepID=UPI0009938C2E|nr:NCS2 family permease [Mycobacterium sp. D16Q16]
MNGLLDRYFRISERQSTLGREVRGGVVTFFAMAYIVVLNPLIIGGEPGRAHNADVLGHVLPVGQVAAVTALAAGVMSILFGFIANYPFALAAGLGINSLLAVSFASQMSWPEAMGLVIVDGLVIVALGISGFRTAVFHAIPDELKAAIAAGIGCFIAFIGFVDAGFVRRIPDAANSTVPVGLGIDNSVATVPTLIFAAGVLLMGILVVRKVRGGLLIGIVVMTGISMIAQALTERGAQPVDTKGWNLTVPDWPASAGGIPDLSLLGQVDMFGAFTRVGVLSATVLVFALVLSNFFDAMGTMTGLGKEAGLTDEHGTLPGIGRALSVEGVGAVVGGVSSSSSNTVFVESASGVAEGARTGLANVVTGLLFLAAMFFTPLYSVVPLEAAAPALVVVGAMMIGQLRSIDFTRFDHALPCFLTVVTMPFTYSIANGIGVGFISWVVLAVVSAERGARRRAVHPLLYVVAGLFVVYFAKGPIESLIT